jgi:hypothetical protein
MLAFLSARSVSKSENVTNLQSFTSEFEDYSMTHSLQSLLVAPNEYALAQRRKGIAEIDEGGRHC